MRLLSVFITLFAVVNCMGGQHRFICVDNGANRLIYVNQMDEALDWSVDIPKGSRDMQLIGKDTVLVSHGNGAGEYSLKDGRLLKVISDKYSGINSVRRMEDGGTILIGRSGDVYLLDKEGKQIRQFKINVEKLDIRLARFNAKGNLMVVQTREPRCLVEADMTGAVVRTVPVSGKGYCAHELKNGNILISAGDTIKVIEIDSTGKIIRYAGGIEKYPDRGMDFFSGFDVLPGGGVVVANWLGHGKQGTAPHLFEFDRENNIVWTWEDHEKARQVTNVLVLE